MMMPIETRGVEQAPVYNMLQRLSTIHGGSNGFGQSTFAKRQRAVDSVLGTPHVVDLGQQKDHMAEVGHGQGKLYRSVPSLYEATSLQRNEHCCLAGVVRPRGQ